MKTELVRTGRGPRCSSLSARRPSSWRGLPEALPALALKPACGLKLRAAPEAVFPGKGLAEPVPNSSTAGWDGGNSLVENQPILRRWMPAFSSPGRRTLSSQRPRPSTIGTTLSLRKVSGLTRPAGGHQPCPGEAKDRHLHGQEIGPRPSYYYCIYVYPRGPSEPYTRPNPIAKNCPVRAARFGATTTLQCLSETHFTLCFGSAGVCHVMAEHRNWGYWLWRADLARRISTRRRAALAVQSCARRRNP